MWSERRGVASVAAGSVAGCAPLAIDLVRLERDGTRRRAASAREQDGCHCQREHSRLLLRRNLCDPELGVKGREVSRRGEPVRASGVRANAMVVWRVADEQLEEAGLRLASAPEVSHCYARNAIDGFPHTLYSVTHGPDQESCRKIAARRAAAPGRDRSPEPSP